MRKVLIYLFLLSFSFVLNSCEKEIAIDYRQVDPLYVAEATMSQEGTKVQVSTTQDVTVNSREGHYINNATVVISCKREDYSETLKFTSNGTYTSSWKATPGYTYDIDISVDGKHFTSSSTMQEAPVMKSFRFVWKKMLSEKILFGDLHIQDTKDKKSYYFMHIYRNGVGYRWAVMNDDKDPNGDLQQLFQCSTERKMDEGDSDALKDGDKIRLEIRSIDKLSYDYLYSMQVMDNAGTNPIANFTGGCLGYFSAYYVVSYYYTFNRSEVEEE